MRGGLRISTVMRRVAFLGIALSFPLQAIAVSSMTASVPSCSWERPGHSPFMGDVVAAVDRYGDIPADSRARLKARMERRDYDDLVVITRDSITGKADYRPTSRDMPFGNGAVCGNVTRETWTPSMQERGLVYCDSGNCILVPTVCRNVSRITRAEVSPDHAEAPEAPGAPGGVPGVPGGADTAYPGTSMAGGLLPGVPAARPLSADPESSFEEASSPGFAVPPGADFSSPSTPQGGPGASPSPPGSVFVPGLGVPPPIGFPGAILAPAPVVPIAPIAPVTSVPPALPVVPLVPTPVPEPETWALMLSGLAAFAWLRRRAEQRS